MGSNLQTPYVGMRTNDGCAIGMLCILIKQPNVLRKICSHGNIAHYLFLDVQKREFGEISLSVVGVMMKLFLAWREKGDAG